MTHVLQALTAPASGAFSSFQEVFNSYGETISQLNLPYDANEAKTKTWSVWSYLPAVATGALAVAQAVSCLVYALLGNTAESVIQGVSAAISCYAAICLVNYMPLMSLEGYAILLGQRGRNLKESVRTLQTENQNLHTNVTQFNRDIDNHKKELANQKKVAQEALSSLDITTQKLVQAENKLESLQKLFNGFEKATGDVSQKISSFTDQNKLLSITSDELNQEISKLAHTKVELDLSTTSVHDEILELQTTRDKAQGTANQIQEQFAKMGSLLVNFKHEIEQGRQEIEKLKKTAQELQATTKNTTSAAQTMEDKTHQLETQVERMERLATRLQQNKTATTNSQNRASTSSNTDTKK